MRGPRWTKPQASALALLKGGRRLRFTGAVFVLNDPQTDQDHAAVVAATTVLRLARAGVLHIHAAEGQLYAARALVGGAAQRGKAAAAGAYLEDELT